MAEVSGCRVCGSQSHQTGDPKCPSNESSSLACPVCGGEPGFHEPGCSESAQFLNLEDFGLDNDEPTGKMAVPALDEVSPQASARARKVADAQRVARLSREIATGYDETVDNLVNAVEFADEGEIQKYCRDQIASRTAPFENINDFKNFVDTIFPTINGHMGAEYSDGKKMTIDIRPKIGERHPFFHVHLKVVSVKELSTQKYVAAEVEEYNPHGSESSPQAAGSKKGMFDTVIGWFKK